MNDNVFCKKEMHRLTFQTRKFDISLIVIDGNNASESFASTKTKVEIVQIRQPRN